MLLQNIRLRELIQATPVCSTLDTLTTALELLSQSQSDRLVLVDNQQHPIGLVNLHRLLPHLVRSQQAIGAIAPGTEVALQTSLQAMTPSVIDPLMMLPAEWSLGHFLNYLNTHNQSNYALVDGEGKFLGLLDTVCLFQSLADGLATSPSDPGSKFHLSAGTTTQSSESAHLPIEAIAGELGTQQSQQQRQILQLTQQLLAQRSELEQRIKAQQEEINYLRVHQRTLLQPELLTSLAPPRADTSLSSDLTLFNSLLELLERLPLPLMLQTNSGKVLGQNSIWREQIGELLDPAWVRREAAVWLDGSQLEAAAMERTAYGISEQQSLSSEASPADHQVEPPTSDPFQARLSHLSVFPEDTSSTPPNPGICHLGSTPGTCVCICPLKDGREQVVQFIKIPFGTLQPNWHLDWSESATDLGGSIEQSPESNPQSLSHPFRLATLTLKLDGEELSSETESAAVLAEPCDRPPPGPPETTPQPAPEMLWLVLAQDVTEQQQLARELTAKNADLVQLNRLKDEFLACISHELKTPLTAVLGLSSLLKDQTLGELNQRQVHYAQLIYQSSRHLMSVVNDILDLTRIETGQLELLYEPVNISTVCSRAFEQAKQQRLLENKSNDSPQEEHFTAQFSLEIELGLESLVADELRLRQMLVHLLSNALKFTEISNPVGLRVNRWGGWIAFTIWDTGIGIAAEKQHLIFQKFQQLENPLTRRFEGAGLGLVLTRRLARLHGGDVTFISKEGQGSQFTVLLPPSPPEKTQLTRGGEQEDEDPSWTDAYPGGRVSLYSQHHTFGASLQPNSPPIVSTASRSRLILIVEAVPHLIETLTDQLTGLGYRVVIARSGTEALEKARRLQPGIIFLNPLLPLLSGWDVLTLLKSNQETQHIPIVITATKVDKEQAHLSQANDFLSLPVQTKVLQQTLQQLLNQTEDPESQTRSSNNLTILHLYSGIHGHRERSGSGNNLNQLLQLRRCRILESDDLDQAELLARVWKPTVILLDGTIPNPTAYLQQLSYHPFLSALPLVTLSQEITQAANQIPGLMVFPCLSSANSNSAVDGNPEIATLLQVIQIAAGFVWCPLILAVDVSALSMSADMDSALGGSSNHELDNFPKETEWLQALIQYLQTAGFRGLIGHSWQEVLQQVQSQSVDLLIICWTGVEPESAVLDRISMLQQMETKPPVIVLDHRYHDGADQSTVTPLPEAISQIAAQVLSPPLSVTELLDQIHQVIQGDEGVRE